MYPTFLIVILFIGIVFDLLIKNSVIIPIISVPLEHTTIIFESTIPIILLGMTIITTIVTLGNGKYLGVNRNEFLSKELGIKNLFTIQLIIILLSYLCMIFNWHNTSFLMMFYSLLIILYYGKNILEFSISEKSVKNKIEDHVLIEFNGSDDKEEILSAIVEQNIIDTKNKKISDMKSSYGVFIKIIDSVTKEDFSLIENALARMYTENLDTDDARILFEQYEQIRKLYEEFNDNSQYSRLYEMILRPLILSLKRIDYQSQLKYSFNFYNFYNLLKENSTYTSDADDRVVHYWSYIYRYFGKRHLEDLKISIFRDIARNNQDDDAIDLKAKLTVLINLYHDDTDLFKRIFNELIMSAYNDIHVNQFNIHILFLAMVIYYVYIDRNSISQDSVNSKFFDQIFENNENFTTLTDYFEMIVYNERKTIELYEYLNRNIIPYFNSNWTLWKEENDYSFSSVGGFYHLINYRLFLWLIGKSYEYPASKLILERYLSLDHHNYLNIYEGLLEFFDYFNEKFEYDDSDSKEQYDNLLMMSQDFIKKKLQIDTIDRDKLDIILTEIREKYSKGSINNAAKNEKYNIHYIIPNPSDISDENMTTNIEGVIENWIDSITTNILLEEIRLRESVIINRDKMLEIIDEIELENKDYVLFVSKDLRNNQKIFRENIKLIRKKHHKIDFDTDKIYLIDLGSFSLNIESLLANQDLQPDVFVEYYKENIDPDEPYGYHSYNLEFKEGEYIHFLENHLVVINLELYYGTLKKETIKIYELGF